MSGIPEDRAARILHAAINEGRAGELLECLFDGGSCTVDLVTHRLVLASAEQLQSLHVLDLGPGAVGGVDG